ncbi:TBC domain-containing protein kinase-like protein, partial [Saccoglossus kowalevskii]|uniref:TBC domain-containing protein kinase-like protein-like n=1 Tax=Saccoglossus kowalevskii TaxID=10224 RepID=A0ABM0M9U6_SACKO
MQALNKAELGVSLFFASTYANDKCGANGLPLTPNSIKILGRFQKLKTISHPRLCQYVDMVRGKHERLMVVQEYYNRSLESERQAGIIRSCSEMLQIAYEILQGLKYMNKHNIVHRTLSPSNIFLDPEGHVKLSSFGRYYMTDGGADVTFPIGYPRFMAPEVIGLGPVQITDYHMLAPIPSNQNMSGPKVDVWSLGMILLELYLDQTLWSSYTLPQTFAKIMFLAKHSKDEHPLDVLIREHNALNKLHKMPGNLQTLIRHCLIVSPHK